MQRCGMRNSRRGSMQLGIETVVILIIAIVLLGSMIYFIKSLIKPEDLGGLIGEQLGCGKTTIPTEATPILPSTVKVEAGKVNDVGVCVKNTYGVSLSTAKVYLRGCLKPDGTPVAEGAELNRLFKVTSNGEDFKRNELKAVPFKLDASEVKEEDLGTWICRVQVSKEATAIAETTNPGVGPIQLTFDVE